MAMFRKFKNQSALNRIWYHLSCQHKTVRNTFQNVVHYSKKLKNTRVLLKWTRHDLKCICVLKCMRAVILTFDLCLLISVAGADYVCVFSLYLTSLLSNYFYLFIIIHKALWPNRQGKRLLRMQVQNLREAVEPLLQKEAQTYKYNLLSISLLVISRLGM